MPASKQHEQFKRSRTGAELPKLSGRTLALAIHAGDAAARGRSVSYICASRDSAQAVRSWLRTYYPVSCNRIEVSFLSDVPTRPGLLTFVEPPESP